MVENATINPTHLIKCDTARLGAVHLAATFENLGGMAPSPPPCFRLEATRGPHAGEVHRHCWRPHDTEASPVSSVAPLSIGRRKRCWLRLQSDLEVSSVHAELRVAEGDCDASLVLRDVKSTNGTKLNGKPLKAQQDFALKDGDLIGVGRTGLRFVQVAHGPRCGEEGDSDTVTAALTPSATPSVKAAPVVIVLDEESAEEMEAPVLSSSAPISALAENSDVVSAAAGSSETSADQPDTEPSHGELSLKVAQTAVVRADTNEGKREGVGLSVPRKARPPKEKGDKTGGVAEFTPEEATCTVCGAVIGRLDLLEQQAHLNKCLGGRVAAKTADSTGAKSKARKRGSATAGTTRAKKTKKLKADKGGDDIATAPKAKKPRKRKRVGTGEDIELALALAPTSKLSKEEQTDLQLATTKKKLEQLDEQMAKLAKRRANLVKTLDRLERTKEKLRKSQVLPPAKVVKCLNLEAALSTIFPSNRQAHPRINYESKEASVVAARYAPAKGIATDCDEEKRTELMAIAAISMWSRASQQLFGLQRDTLLYRNSVLRTFIDDDKDFDTSIIDIGNDNEDDDDDNGDAGIVDVERDDESEVKAESENTDSVDANQAPESASHDAEVPDVVKRVFPNWQRDLAFLQDQSAEELEMALVAMNEAVAQLEEAAVDIGALQQAGKELREPSDASLPASPKEQRLACEYMARVMTQLITERRKRVDAIEPDEELKEQPVIDLLNSSGEDVQPVIDLLNSSGEDVQPQEVEIIGASDNEAEEEPFFQELPKVAAACGLTGASAEAAASGMPTSANSAAAHG
ncbi:unnamed protein product [Phytophthora lilii]|uniref:Unnamed protein product n=1 Tax=Phytophthora lilii TaxID=2077276 RepID=A0A9W6U2U6_9STRA|nr:unnamed protein product [Phytophthora lilii]